MSLVLPAWVQSNLERERAVDGQIALALEWTKILRQRDDRLSVVWVGDYVPSNDMVANRWHVRRRNDPPADDSYFAITTPDGGYREPDGGVAEEMAARDMRRPGNSASGLLQRRQREQDAKDRDALRQREDRKHEMANVIQTLSNPPSIVITEKMKEST